MKSYITIYTDSIIPGRFAAYTIGPIILIRPSKKEDRGLLEHEIVHVKQFWSNPFTFGLKYLFSESFRLQSEVEAYKKQLEFCAGDKEDALIDFSILLVRNYKLDITTHEAYQLLIK